LRQQPSFAKPQILPEFPCQPPNNVPISSLVGPKPPPFQSFLPARPGQYKPKEQLPIMRQNSVEIQSLVELRQFVSRTLCQINDFEEGIFQVTERVLLKCGECCGILFCLHGPRSVRLTAVWETITNSINFYDSTGEKIQKTILPLPVAVKE
jgi:hypothetical protein